MAVRKDEKTKKWYFYGKYKDPITNKYKDCLLYTSPSPRD